MPLDRSKFIHRRPDYAGQLADALVGLGIEDHTSGLFLAAPRRTGKSTFLRHDLKPAMESRGVTVLLIDLWERRDAEPADLVTSALREAVRSFQAGFHRSLRESGVEGYGIGGLLKVDLVRMGLPEDATLTAMLRALVIASGKPVCLMLDEAQQMLATEKGLAMTFALKAARDALNQEESLVESEWRGRNLIIVCTGSHRDKLAHLVLNREAAFYGARVTSFPLLGKEYVDAYSTWLSNRLGPESPMREVLGGDHLVEAFTMLWNRPEKLVAAVSGFMASGGTLLESVGKVRVAAWDDMRRDYEALRPLDRAVLARLITEGSDFAPYSSDNLTYYERIHGRKLDVRLVTASLDRLREAKLVWRSARGTYALENQDLAEWFTDVAGMEPEPVAPSQLASPQLAEDNVNAAEDIGVLAERGMSLLALASCLGVGWRSAKRWSDAGSRGPSDGDVRHRLHSLRQLMEHPGVPRWEAMSNDEEFIRLVSGKLPQWDRALARALELVPA